MLKKLLRLCSMMLVIVMVINMLPMQSIAADFRASLTTDQTDLGVQEDAKDARIVEEITSERTEYSKEFKLQNGLHMAAVYNDPVHYLEEGSWKEIDNTLILEGLGTNRVYTNTAGVWDVQFPQQLSKNNAVTITKDGYTLSFGLAGELHSSGLVTQTYNLNAEAGLGLSVTDAASVTAQLQAISSAVERPSDQPAELTLDKLTSRLQYANVYANTNIVYDLKSNQVKESIVINQYSSTLYGYRYTLNTGDMIPVLGEDGHIDLYDADRKNIVMTMPAPFLVDDANAYSFDVNVTLTQSGDSYILTYLLPRQWLASAERSWPVVLDPVVSASTTLANIDDQTVAEKQQLSHTWGMVQVGYNTNSGVSRFFVKYNSLPPLTSSDVVVSASISLHLLQTFNDSQPVEVHKVLDTWKESSLHWSNKPDFDGTIEDFALVKNSDWYTWDITDIVRGWYSGQNTGMMFKMSDAVEAARQVEWRQFESAEYGYNDPSLTIVFRNNNGLESYWDYTVQDAGRAGTGYINNYTGNLVWVRHDMGFDGSLMPVSISHIYNANDSATLIDDDGNNANDSAGNGFGLGCGWRTNYNQLVYRWSEDSDYYVWEDSDGTDHYFYYTAANTYEDEDGLELTLTTNGSGTQKYTITDKYGNKSYFDTEGRLTKLENNQQTKSSINITYISSGSRLISTITDGAGRLYVFTYTDGLLTRLSYMGSGTTEITYVTYWYWGSQLEQVTDKDRHTCMYEYDAKNLLTWVYGIDQYELNYSYNTLFAGQPSRVSDVRVYDETAGGTLHIEYANNQTTFTDHNGNVQIMQFNNWGNTLSVQDGEGRAQYGQYANNDATDEDNEERAHQLRLSSKLQNTVGNRLTNSSFESTSSWYSNSSALTLSRTTGAAYLGNYSLKMTNSASSTVAAVGSSFTVLPGETYTFSAYVKTGGANAVIALQCGADNSTYTGSQLSPNKDWCRLEVSYTNTTQSARSITPVLLLKTAGTAYMDCVQVEKAPTASRYNIIQNGDFSNGLTGWTNDTFTSADCVVTTGDPAPAAQLDNHVLTVSGAPASSRQMLQNINISGNAGDTYVISGWAKGDSVPVATSYDTNTRSFDVVLVFNNNDNTTTRIAANFNPFSDQWQYAATAAVADKAYHSMTVMLTYNFNANTACFDGIQLYKEEFGISYTYDDDKNIISVKNLQGQVTMYDFDDETNSKLLQVIQNNKAKMTYTYDSYHNVKTATTQEGLVYTFTYDTYGNNTRVSISADGLTMSSSAAYTADGNRLVSTTDAAGNITLYSYNANTGLLEWVEYPENTEDTRTNYEYDNMYRLFSVWIDTETNYMCADYSYYDDRLSAINTSATNYRFIRGDFDLVTEVREGSRILATYTYSDDENFDLIQLDYGNGHRVEYEYDDQGRVTKEIYKDTANEAGETVTYQYDNSGALAVVTDSETGITTKYHYDFTDRLMKQVETGTGYNHTIAYTYDSINNLTALVETINGVGHTTSYAYDDDNRIKSVVSGTAAKSYKYDDFGRIAEQKTKHNGSDVKTETLTYRNLNASTTTGQVASYAITAPGYQMNYTYTYDGNGNILSISDGTHTTSYVYDEMNQLLRENNQAAGYTRTWEYDGLGNIVRCKQYAYTTGTLGTATETVRYDYYQNVLTSYGDTVLTNDEIGNRLSDENWQYTWHHGRQLASITNGSTTWNYTYNADGLRTQKTNGSQTYTYVYNGGQLTQMVKGSSDTLYFAYDASGLPMTVTWNGTVYYYVTNLQGDVTAILNASGAVVTKYTYDAWGKLLTATGSMASTIGTLNPLRYRGYVYDLETGFYYLQSRYYDPVVGRFINADAFVSTGQGLIGYNMFVYCGNNPVINVDSTGTFSERTAGCGGDGLAYAGPSSGHIYRPTQPSITINIPVSPLFLPALSTEALRGEMIDIRSGNRSKAQAEEQATTIVVTPPNSTNAVFYGADIYGGTWKIVTGPLTTEGAKLWVAGMAANKVYGKRTSWGLYTTESSDAFQMAWDLGLGTPPIPHAAQVGRYPHYHVSGFVFLGMYKHFHIWFGSMG